MTFGAWLKDNIAALFQQKAQAPKEPSQAERLDLTLREIETSLGDAPFVHAGAFLTALESVVLNHGRGRAKGILADSKATRVKALVTLGQKMTNGDMPFFYPVSTKKPHTAVEDCFIPVKALIAHARDLVTRPGMESLAHLYTGALNTSKDFTIQAHHITGSSDYGYESGSTVSQRFEAGVEGAGASYATILKHRAGPV